MLLAPTTRAVFADRVDGIFDGLEGKGGRVLGRSDSEWVDGLKEWLK